MDILTHTFTGFAVGTIFAGFSRNKKNADIILLSGLGGALPDIDAISMWSKFDATFGKFFGLSYSGKVIYTSKFWYSHHAFFHSILCAFLFAVLILTISWIFHKKTNKSFINYILTHKLLAFGFILAYAFHLFEDMPTPIGAWKGVAFLWPYFGYIGGSGQMWWWNNYNIFLIAFTVFILNLIILSLKNKIQGLSKFIPLLFFLFGLGLSIHQINTRSFDFNCAVHGNKYEFLEQKSKEIQKEILGVRLYAFMEFFDNKTELNF